MKISLAAAVAGGDDGWWVTEEEGAQRNRSVPSVTIKIHLQAEAQQETQGD